jgi:hypothetical protein
MGDEVKSRFRMFQRQGGVFYWQDNQTKQQGNLGIKDKHAALKLLHAKNEAHEQPILNLALAEPTRPRTSRKCPPGLGAA